MEVRKSSIPFKTDVGIDLAIMHYINNSNLSASKTVT